ncbi:FeoB-associated Cys-rich membrane protein [Brevibacillus daliensis]|uniref:FeoB-associated Cys-rich membrane protein n=1 Tax=Brevibacillus daliensis TaxID=2892995 RepID=UPI001E4C5148|nr:FeoB-associated Cys-rich membrane protein [Brevibacillus daliensis]
MLGILLNWLVGLLVFGYAGWSIYRYYKRSKKGKCAGCSVEKSCSSGCKPKS